MTMLIPMTGVIGDITKMAEESPSRAAATLRFALYDALVEQADQCRPAIEREVMQAVAKRNRGLRTSLLRNHVGKAINGEQAPDDSDLAATVSVVDEWVEKGLVGWALSQFNSRVKRAENGRFASSDSNGAPDGQDEPPKRSGSERGAIDVMQLATGANDTQARRMTQGLFEGGHVRPGDSMASSMNGPTSGTDRQAYSRLRATGGALAAMSGPGSNVRTAANIAQFAGELGPEAEKVLGPSVRRTAYRYRGTQRKPERGIVDTVADVDNVARVKSGTATAAGAMTSAAARVTSDRRVTGRPEQDTVASTTSDPVRGIFGFYRNKERMSSDQLGLKMRGDAVVANLLGIGGPAGSSHLPNMDLVRLSMESGEMPPSEGVMIDHKGKVTAQAIGYNGDHYLPFDLSTMGALQGGQYVRTRATGGLTGEDIYTGLVSGARQAQVVSNSGVFTLEFDPDFRGSRRFNDKAHRMIDRYQKILGAIADPESNLFVQDLDAATKQGIKRDVARVARNQKDFGELYTQRLNEARLRSVGSNDTVDEIRSAAQGHAQRQMEREMGAGSSMTRQQQARFIQDATDEFVENYFESGEGAPEVQRMQLDGEGYGQALLALKQEFPYYIRSVDYQPVREFLVDRSLHDPNNRPSRQARGTDVGFVEQGQTNTVGQRQGANSRRTVPTSLRATGRKADASTTEISEGAPSAAGAAAAVASSSDASRSMAERVVGLKDLQDNLVFRQKLATDMSNGIRDLKSQAPDGVPAPADSPLEGWGRGTYYRSQARLFAVTAQSPDVNPSLAMAKWAMTAPVSDVKDFVAGVREGAEGSFADLRQDDREDVKLGLKNLASAVEGYIALAEPFDTRTGEQIMQDGHGDKPPKVEGLPAVGAPMADYEQFYARSPENVRGLIDDYRADIKDVPSRVNSALEAVKSIGASGVGTHLAEAKRDYTESLAAWSFLAAESATRALRTAIGGDAAPKAPAPAAAPAKLQPAPSVFGSSPRPEGSTAVQFKPVKKSDLDYSDRMARALGLL